MAIVIAICVALLFPIYSSFADGLSVTTNKDIYSQNERVFVFGITPTDLPNSTKAIVSIIAPDGQLCHTIKNIGLDQSRGFVSRPIDVSSCGFGKYTVVALFSGLNATTTFIVSGHRNNSTGLDPELQQFGQQISERQSIVNSRILNISESGMTIPSKVAAEYAQANSYSSSVIQAIRFGDVANAKLNARATITVLDQILGLLPELNSKTQLDNNTSQGHIKQTDQRDLAISEALSRLQLYSSQLQKLAATNGENTQSFGTVASLLSDAQLSLDHNDVSGAQLRIANASSMLQGIHNELYDKAQQQSINSTITNSRTDKNSTESELKQAANRIEKDVNDFLAGNANMSSEAKTSLQESLGYVAKARTDLEHGNTDDARKSLSTALNLFVHAKGVAANESAHHGKKHH